MDSFIVYCSICCWLVLSTDGVTLTLEMTSILPLKGSSLALSCRILEPFNSNGIAVWKGTSQVTICYGDSYLCDYIAGYNFTTNSTGVYGSISNLTTEAEGTWRCSYRTTSGGDLYSNPWDVIVYTIPSGLFITQDPNQNVDLIVNSVVLQCKTIGCTYPMPTVQWILQDQTTSSENNYTTDNPTGIQGTCVTEEKLYTSTLNLSLYTTLNDNGDKTGTFSCRIEYPDSSRNIIAYASNTVRFAVRVTEVVLQQNNKNITDLLTVNVGEPVALTCITGLSRPDPTIDWYIGSQKRGSGPGLNFTPSNADHNQTIYCQAYNTDPNRIVYSLKPRLSVQVRVTEAVLQQNNQNVSDILMVISGKPITLTCMTGLSRPDPTIDWYIGSQKRGSGPGLNFTPSNADHSQIIYCQAYNTDPNRIVYSLKPRLSVQVYVSTVTLDPLGDIITFLDGTANSLRCTTDPSRPQPVIRWWLDGNEVTNQAITRVTGNGTLFIASSELHLIVGKAQKGKKVHCDAKVNDQADVIESVKPEINVWYQPSLPSIQAFQGNFPWLENQTGTLQCVMADSGNPKASVIWTSSKGTLDMDSNLVFRNLSANDHGQPVYCKVQNNFTDIKGLTVVSPTVALNVEYRPSITLNPSVQPLRTKEGSNLTVTCMASGNPQPIVQWKNRKPPSNTLHIPSILRNSTGSYTCVASSTSTNYNHVLLQREESTRVIVEYAPDAQINISRSTIVSSSVVLMCVPKGEPPQYTFHPWIHMVGQTEIRRLDGVNTVSLSTLSLSNISIQDMGTYICTVDNSITGLDGQINQRGDTLVYVQGPPVIGETHSTFTGETDKSASIEVPFYSNSSNMTVRFSKHLDSFEISNTSNVSIYISPSNITLTFYTEKVMIPGHVAVLFFRNVTDRDFDNYTLKLSNEKGSVTRVFDFIASAPPSAPKKFFFSHIDDGLLVFGMEKGFDGGHLQTFVVEYQPFGMPEATWSTILKINETDLDSSSTNGIYYIKIPKLQDGPYIFRVYAENKIGNSSAIEGVYVDIKTEQTSGGNLPVAAITGGIIGPAIFVIAIVVVAIIVKRRTQGPKMEAFEGEEMDSTDGKHQVSGLKDNPVYDSSESGPVMQVDTAVVKPKRMFSQTEDPSKLYAQVDKSNANKGKTASKGKPVKTSKAAPKGKPLKSSRGDVYENTPLPLKSSAENEYENPGHLAADPSESVYENPEASAAKGQLVNKDGLLYADLKFGPPTTKYGKPVIHGLENRTEYADIAFGKRGEPLPETDEEKEGDGSRKNNGTKMKTDE